jgi:hypothetical protein
MTDVDTPTCTLCPSAVVVLWHPSALASTHLPLPCGDVHNCAAVFQDDAVAAAGNAPKDAEAPKSMSQPSAPLFTPSAITAAPPLASSIQSGVPWPITQPSYTHAPPSSLPTHPAASNAYATLSPYLPPAAIASPTLAMHRQSTHLQHRTATSLEPHQHATPLHSQQLAASAGTHLGVTGMQQTPVLMWVTPVGVGPPGSSSMLFQMTPATQVPPQSWPAFAQTGQWASPVEAPARCVPSLVVVHRTKCYIVSRSAIAGPQFLEVWSLNAAWGHVYCGNTGSTC